MAKIVASKSGKHPNLLYNGFSYHYERKGAEKIFWRCSKVKSFKCNGRLHTSENLPSDGSNVIVYSEIGVHTHGPDPVEIEVRVAQQEMKAAAASSSEPTAVIVSKMVSSVSRAAVGSMAKVSSCKRTVRRVRHVNLQGALVTPNSRCDLVLPQLFTSLQSGENFLAFNSGANLDRILMFTCAENLKFLQFSKSWFCDGTFKSSPSLFDQLFIIHAEFSGNVFPLVYALTPNRTKATYDAYFQLCCILIHIWNQIESCPTSSMRHASPSDKTFRPLFKEDASSTSSSAFGGKFKNYGKFMISISQTPILLS